METYLELVGLKVDSLREAKLTPCIDDHGIKPEELTAPGKQTGAQPASIFLKFLYVARMN